MGFLAVDIGGTNTLIGTGVGDLETVVETPSEAFLADMGSHLQRALDGIESVDEMAIAAAGPIDREAGTFRPPNIDREAVDIERPFERWGDVRIVNDCTAAVLGEYHYGGHAVDDLLYVTISSGIGAGLIAGGRLIEGWTGNFGEVGHMHVRENGRRCGCGGRGHWEAYCSGNNLPLAAETLTGVSFDDARDVFRRAAAGEAAATEALAEMNRINARAFADLINLYNPAKVLLGGAVALNHPQEVVAPLAAAVEGLIATELPVIELCALRETAVLHGLRAVCTGDHEL